MWRYPGSQDVLLTDFSSSFGIFTSYYRHILFDLCPFLSQLGAMLEFFDSSAKLVGHSGSILLPEDDEITRKVAMLFEGQCEGLGPTLAARKFGYTKQRYFQLLEQFEAQSARAKDQLSAHRRDGSSDHSSSFP